MPAHPDYHPDTNELGVAAWAFEHDQPAGLGTDTLPAVSLRCQPLKTARGLVGVLGVRLKEKAGLLTPEQRQTFNAFCHQAALAVERASLAEQARQAELLQATEKLQTALLNSISHDLRTPLVSITGALSSLREETSHLDQEDRDSLIDTAYGEAERLNRLVGNLLNMTRLEAGAIHLNREPCDIQDAIGSALEELEERLGDRQIKVDVPRIPPLISLDFALFVQVLVNLLDNAVKYSPPDTRIEVDRVFRAQDAVQIEICDRGIGIPPEDLERVFDKFYRVQRPESVSGTGLGLAICKGIIEAHGGNIQASNRPGGGTIISLCAAAGGCGMTKAKLRVLVVDDEVAIQRFLQVALNGQGFQVIVAATGEDALQKIALERPDLVILDLGLPDMDGVEVTRRLREWTAVPVIILSVREQEDEKIAALDAGADDYLTKPFGMGELLARIRVALRRQTSAASEPVFQLGGWWSTWRTAW